LILNLTFTLKLFFEPSFTNQRKNMRKPTFLLLTALLCFLLLTLHGQTAHAAADIQPTSFLDNPDPVPARGEVVYSVVVKSNDIANPVTDAWLEIPLPADFTFVSVNDPGCLYSGSSPSAGGSDKIRCDWSTITSQKMSISTFWRRMQQVSTP